MTVACADDMTPEGYRPLGPAVAFGPEHTRLSREIPLTLPIRLVALPEGDAVITVITKAVDRYR